MKNFSSSLSLTGFSAKLYRLLLLPLIYGLLLTVTSCETPEKVLKSTDIEYKKAKAKFWYNKKEYFKCIPVLEELIGLLKGRESVEEYYYMYCKANYEQGDYLISAYHFKYFFDQYTTSAHAEECLFMHAKSYQRLSPKPELDQTFTYKALEAYAYFLSMYPQGTYINESNEAVQQLRRKLEKKALANAELYYKTDNFKAAATSYENLLVDFPDIEESEKISFMIVKANYRYADNSIPSKKLERFNHVISSHQSFKYKFPSSKYLEEATKYETQSHYLAVKGAFEYAEGGPLEEREKLFRIAFAEAKAQEPFVTNEKNKLKVAQMTEKGYFLIVKNNYLLSEIKKGKEKEAALNQTVKTYYNFADLFPKSKYAKEAERLFNNSKNQIAKLKKNG